MWPFDDPDKQIVSGAAAPKLGLTPQGDPKDLKIKELEQRLMGLEYAVTEICKAIKMHNDLTDNNFRTMERNFMNLVQYAVQPKNILGDQQGSN
jgi:hypothetical protein